MKVIFNQGVNKIDISGLRALAPDVDFVETHTADDVAREIGDADSLSITNRVYLADMVKAVNENAKTLKWINFRTSGIDKALKHGGFLPGTVVTNATGLSAPTLSEHAFSLFMFLARNFRATEEASPRHDWIRDGVSPSVFSFAGRTMAILGMGQIGQSMARKAKAFEMKVIAVSRDYKPDDSVDEVFPRERVKEALAQADAVLISMPSIPETHGFMDADKLSAMKKSAYLVNIARGALVNEPDLIAACKSGQIAGAGLDVTVEEPTPADSPLWDVPNIVLTPHIGGVGDHTPDRQFARIARNIELYQAGKPLEFTVDWESMVD